MMRVGTGSILALSFTMVLPTVGALVLEGELAPRIPIDVAGVVTLASVPDFTHATAATTEAFADEPRRLFASPEVLIRIVRHSRVQSPAGDTYLEVPIEPQGPGPPRAVREARLDVVNLTAAGQAYVQDGSSAENRLEAHGAFCRIEHASTRDELAFPNDSAQLTTPLSPRAGPDELAAECDVDHVTATEPGAVFLYGMDLHLITADRTEWIRTGTFDEADPAVPALVRRVTQVLEIYALDAPLTVDLPFESRLRFFARDVLAAGTIQVGSANGLLRWGDLEAEGEIAPFHATGVVLLTGRPGTMVGLAGETVNGPAPAGGTRGWPAVSLGTVGLVAAAVIAAAVVV